MRRTKTTILRRSALVQIAVTAIWFPSAALAQTGQAGHPGHVHPAPPAAATPAAPAAAKPATSVPAAPAAPASVQSTDAVTAGVNESMAGHMDVNPHMKLTPVRPATASDSARAAHVVVDLRHALERYKDVRVAEADGYKMFAPKLPQEVYHFTSTWRSVKEAFRFDPAQPSSLLYRRTPSGSFELVGAMYHAPKRLSPDELDERVPLGIARWHAHTNFCVPGRGERERWAEMKNGKPVFGPQGDIVSKQQCDAVGGKFHEQVFGWMVHAMVFAGDDPATIWGADHAGHGDHHR